MGQELSKTSDLPFSSSQNINNDKRKLYKEIGSNKFKNQPQSPISVLIKGLRKTGKTTLLHKLEGKGFPGLYNPTTQNTFSRLNWKIKPYDETILDIDLWDVCGDAQKSELSANFQPPKSKSYDSLVGLEKSETDFQNSTGNSAQVPEKPNAVILLFDLSEPESFDYVKNEILKMKFNAPVLILGNFRDKEEQIKVSNETITSFVESFNKKIEDAMKKQPEQTIETSSTNSQITEKNETETQKTEEMNCSGEFWNRCPLHYVECSLKNRFGWKQIQIHFNLMFYELKMSKLRKTIKELNLEFKDSDDEVALTIENSDYDMYIQMLKEAVVGKQTIMPARSMSMSFSQQDTSIQSPMSTLSQIPEISSPNELQSSFQSPNSITRSVSADTMSQTKNMNDISQIVDDLHNNVNNSSIISEMNNESINSAEGITIRIDQQLDDFDDDDDDENEIEVDEDEDSDDDEQAYYQQQRYSSLNYQNASPLGQKRRSDSDLPSSTSR